MRKALFCAIVISFLVSGCITKLSSDLVPGASLDQIRDIYVVKFAPDKRNLHLLIADQLSLMGYRAKAGETDEPPEGTRTVVTYQDNWQWDITNYMIKIRIQFRDAKDNTLIVSGESYRTSLARESPEDMIKETLEEILKIKKHENEQKIVTP